MLDKWGNYSNQIQESISYNAKLVKTVKLAYIVDARVGTVMVKFVFVVSGILFAINSCDVGFVFRQMEFIVAVSVKV